MFDDLRSEKHLYRIILAPFVLVFFLAFIWKIHYVFAVDPISISSCEQLQLIGSDEETYPLDGDYILTTDIDCSMTNPEDPDFDEEGTWGEGVGFHSLAPSDPFSGSFDGNGHTITGLFFHADGHGIFASTEQGVEIENLGLINFQIVDGDRTAALVSDALGDLTITNCYVQGSFSELMSADAVGGLVSTLEDGTLTIIDSYTDIDISVEDGHGVGGLVGDANGGEMVLTNSYTIGIITITGDNNYGVGGLVGHSFDTIITDSHFEGDITSEDGDTVGGLVGYAETSLAITDSYVLGDTTCSQYCGGLVGDSQGVTTITDSHFEGNITADDGNQNAGLVGNFGTGDLSITNSYALGDITCSSNCGGLVGYGGSGTTISIIINSHFEGDITSEDGDTVGGLVGGIVGDTVSITNSYALGEIITCFSLCGGLVGDSQGTTTITSSRFEGSVEGIDYIGGLVGNVSGDMANITNSYMVGDVSAGGATAIGGLAGSLTSDSGVVTSCYVEGDVLTSGAGGGGTGGLLGVITGTTVSKSYFIGTVGGNNIDGAGGLVGTASNSTISESYAEATTTGDEQVGGLVAWAQDTTIINSYSTGDVVGTTAVGGFVGEMAFGTTNISKSYSWGHVTGNTSVGGLVGVNSGIGVVSDSFWDTQTSGQATSAGGTGKTTLQMKTASTFTGATWNFTDIWQILSSLNDGYPSLQWQEVESGEVEVDVEDDDEEVTIDDPDNTYNISIPNGVTGVTLDASSLLSGNSTTLPLISIDATTSLGVIEVDIPADTIVTGVGWSGVINAPDIRLNTSVSVPEEPSTAAQVAGVIEIGAGNTALTFNKGVRILFPDHAGKLVGFSRNGTFTRITNICASDTSSMPTVGNDCHINVGDDLVVWTKHFTSFVVYTIVSSGGVWSGGGGGIAAPIPPAIPPVSPLVQVPPTTTPGVAVLVKTYNLGSKNISYRSRGEVVKVLQGFLNEALKIFLVTDGIFGPKTANAVKKWQKEHGLIDDGIVGPKTKSKINASI